MTIESTKSSNASMDPIQRYVPDSGPALFTGVQAVGRLVTELIDSDRRLGRELGVFVSGYPGSPVAGIDGVLKDLRGMDDSYQIHWVPGQNEELAATAVWGSQTPLPDREMTVDGVVGIWYGKAPGLDRSMDALRHGNMVGAQPTGGVLVIVGDDPANKSSSLPNASERTIASMEIPVLFPSSAAEIIEMGLYGIQLSRTSGHYVALKIITDLADGFSSVTDAKPARELTIPTVQWQGAPFEYRSRVFRSVLDTRAAEVELVGPRRALLREFTRLNPIDRVSVPSTKATLGIVAAGTTHDAMLKSLADLGLDEKALSAAGIRVLKLGMIYPVSEASVLDFCEGLSQVLVVEEKASFIETQIRDILYGSQVRPEVLGKRDASGAPLVPGHGELTGGQLEVAFRQFFAGVPSVQLRAPRKAPLTLELLPVSRTPYFCSGCPHNRSTNRPEGSLAAGGIGCHGMSGAVPRASSDTISITQMGGEGAQWIGQSPFSTERHIFQNVGDGTYFHSGQLGIQACIAAGVSITYKILYNSAIAMTGGQQPQGGISVPLLTRKLAAEGASKIIVCTDDRKKYRRGEGFAPGVEVLPREDVMVAQERLREIPGVTVLIYDQECAAELRRKRKRGQAPRPRTRVLINEEVCEGCGDCGVKSNCLSVQPIQTELGRKTKIDQGTCNYDHSCLEGDCPSFVVATVADQPAKTQTRPSPKPPRVPDPTPRSGDSWDFATIGIGGTGVVTVNQVVATAAMKDGWVVHGLDQTGLSQKAGPVVSHLRLRHHDEPLAGRLGSGEADAYLALDLVVGAEGMHLAMADADRTGSVVSTSLVPTGPMVYSPSVPFPDADSYLARIEAASADCFAIDALGTVQALGLPAATTNMFVIGAAFQRGLIPVSAQSMVEAITLNGVAVDANISAFGWGRVAVAEPHLMPRPSKAERAAKAVARESLALVEGLDLEPALHRLVLDRVERLIAYQGSPLARSYVDEVKRAHEADLRVDGDGTLTETYASNLFKFMAYKDEYEVARMHLAPTFRSWVEEEVGPVSSVSFQLHPPILRAMGLKRKIGFGTRTTPALKILASMRGLRGTWADPFGYARVRRLERALRDEYRAVMAGVLDGLTPATYAAAVDIASAPEVVKGYEGVKMRTVSSYIERMRAHGLEIPETIRLSTVDSDD